MIGRCEIELHQFKDRLEEALSLSASQSVNGLDCGHSLNRQVGISRRGSRLSGQFIGRPILDGFGTEPDGESSRYSRLPSTTWDAPSSISGTRKSLDT